MLLEQQISDRLTSLIWVWTTEFRMRRRSGHIGNAFTKRGGASAYSTTALAEPWCAQLASRVSASASGSKIWSTTCAAFSGCGAQRLGSDPDFRGRLRPRSRKSPGAPAATSTTRRRTLRGLIRLNAGSASPLRRLSAAAPSPASRNSSAEPMPSQPATTSRRGRSSGSPPPTPSPARSNDFIQLFPGRDSRRPENPPGGIFRPFASGDLP